MVRVISLYQAVVPSFTINMYEVCHHLCSLSFVATSGKYVIIICIFEHKTVISMYLPNKIITLWGKLVLWEKEHFSCSAEYFQIQTKPKWIGKMRFQSATFWSWKGFTGSAEKSTRFQFLKKQWFKKSKTRGVMT